MRAGPVRADGSSSGVERRARRGGAGQAQPTRRRRRSRGKGRIFGLPARRGGPGGDAGPLLDPEPLLRALHRSRGAAPAPPGSFSSQIPAPVGLSGAPLASAFSDLEAGPGGGAARGPPLPPGALPGDPRTLGRPSAGGISGRREAGPLPPPRGPGTPPAPLRPQSPCARVRQPVATEFIPPITWAARVSASYAVVLATLDPRPGGYFGAGTRHLKIQ